MNFLNFRGSCRLISFDLRDETIIVTRSGQPTVGSFTWMKVKIFEFEKKLNFFYNFKNKISINLKRNSEKSVTIFHQFLRKFSLKFSKNFEVLKYFFSTSTLLYYKLNYKRIMWEFQKLFSLAFPNLFSAKFSKNVNIHASKK